MPRAKRRNDSGVALVVTIGVVALLVLLLTAAFMVSGQTLFQSQTAVAHDAAFRAASSGILVVLADLQSRVGNLPTSDGASGSLPASEAAYSVSAVLDPTGSAYSCVSTGTAPDGTVEVVTAQFAVGTGGSADLPWGSNVLYASTWQAGTVVSGSQFNGPFYVIYPPKTPFPTFSLGSSAADFGGGPIYVENGNLDLPSNGLSAPTVVYTNGAILLNGKSATVTELASKNVMSAGWGSQRHMSVSRVNWPVYRATSMARALSQSSDDRMGDTTTPNLETLTVGDTSSYPTYFAGWTRPKAPGAGAEYKVISGGLTLSAGTASFGSWSGDAHYPTTGDLHDDFAFDRTGTSVPGSLGYPVLYVEGTVFIDGDLNITTPIEYLGNGTIVCSGKVNIGTNVVPATATNANPTPDPDQRHLLCVYSEGSITLSGVGHTNVVAAMYAIGTLNTTATNILLKGSYVSETGIDSWNNNTTMIAVPIIGAYANPGLPSWGYGGNGLSGVTMISWRRR